MQYNDNSNGRPLPGNGYTNSSFDMQSINQPFYNIKPEDMQGMPRMFGNGVIYPEIYYKLQPFIMMTCDQMDKYTSEMPTQEMMEQMTDSIYDNISRVYPDIIEYASNYEKNASSDSSIADAIALIPGMYERRSGNRGFLRDLINILLLSEFFRRRRRIY